MFKKVNLKKIQEKLQKQKQSYPFELLGKSLASNPYLPRNIYDKLKSSKKILQISFIKKSDFLIKAQDNIKQTNFFMLKIEDDFIVDNISYLRRYFKEPIIRADIMIDKYQILESLVFGADAIMIYPKYLNEDFGKIYSYARHLGLEVIVYIEDKEDLILAFCNNVDLFCIKYKNEKHLEEIIPLCKNGIVMIDKAINLKTPEVKAFIKEI